MRPRTRALRASMAVAVAGASLAACFPDFTFVPDDARLDAAPPRDAANDLDRPETGPIDAGAPLDARDEPAPPVDAGPDAPPAIVLDPGFPASANADNTNGASISTTITTPGPGRMLVAVFVWGTTTQSQEPVGVSGGGVTWTRQVTGVFPDGGAPPGTSGDAVWTAWAAAPLTAQAITATRAVTDSAVLTLGVYSFANASQAIGAVAGYGQQGTDSQLLSTIQATTAGSWIVGGFHAGTANQAIVANANTLWDVTDDPSLAPAGHFNAIGRLAGTVPAPGTITLGAGFVGPYIATSTVEIVPQH